jgi:ankyrin repeat protein
MDAARFGDLADVKTLLAAGADATASESHGITVLHYATEGGNAKVVAALLKLPAVKAQINATQVGGGTPLMGAAKSRSAAIVAQLLNAGADVHARTRMGDTALHYAAAIGDLDEIAALLGHGADINAAANDTSTPLDRVIQSSGSPQAYDAIVKAGGHVGALTQEMGALNFAASSGHEELVRHLLQVLRPAPDVNGCDEQGSPCIVLAAASGNTWCVAALLDAGADANDSRRKDHITALHLAAQQNNVEMIRLLLVHNAAVDARTVPGKVAPIHMAAGRGQLDAIAALLDAGADKEAADENGWTALHWAAHSGQDRAVAFLLKSGFNPDAKRKGGESAADVAQAAGYSEIAATIRASILHAPTQGQ